MNTQNDTSPVLTFLKTALFYLSIVGPIKMYARQVALEAIQEQSDTFREFTRQEMMDIFLHNVGRSFTRKRLVTSIGNSQKVFDEIFEKPTEITAYFDLRELATATHDAARIGLFLGIRGNEENDLTQITSGVLEAPQAEAITIGPAVVVGRVVITFRQLIGEEEREIWYQIHTTEPDKKP
jgi:hypothetical protein